MSGVLFWSDLHLGHLKVSELRNFEDTDAHDTAIGQAWLNTVRPNDQVWILGDITGGRGLPEALEMLSRLPGEKHLVAGNHDDVHPMHTRGHRKQAKYLEVFASVQSAATLKMGGRRVILNHFPWKGAGDHTDHERYGDWRFEDTGGWLIHGHVHDAWLYKDRMINVGYDVHPEGPVRMERLLDRMDAYDRGFAPAA